MVRLAHREKEMKVLALGMSRTGTMSLYAGLKKLSYNCYHMSECNLDVANGSLANWHHAIDAKFNGKGRKYAAEDFDKMLWRYDAVSDIPCILVVDELLAAYPNAQIILTNREVGSWVASLERSFYAILSWKRWPFLELIDRKYTYHCIKILRSALIQWTGGNWLDKYQLPKGYAAHYAHVHKVAAAQGRDVLEFRLQDGWEPLCRYLGKDVPNEPYLHINEGGWAKNLHCFLFWLRFLKVVFGGLKWFAVVGVALAVYRTYYARWLQ